ncbi:ExbD/TolR family protein [Granulosicoccus antarcticus]|uniref:Biopolymer transport protein ExbD n=1 Tax=Granulosicoccus antarcticus IMCC3135 TaxID=1192854 RepID=A0A2Z2NUL4_9GAMM|nr:biopolymer transporter ExbD [Granulosicoccus antarcticus]ASJ75009.1 Biopolymer transport protein ExbD [Granulosicoccus antarcticus IMCC3135]
MKFKREPREELELNLTPLIDVVFLLLIFFMVSTTFQKESEISLQLPRASDTETESSQDRIEIVINAAGHYFINDQELVNSDVATVQNALYKISGGKRDIPLTIRADAQAPHQSVVTAMDAAGQLGMLKMSIATSRSTD